VVAHRGTGGFLDHDRQSALPPPARDALIYEGPDDEGRVEHQEVVVTSETKEVMGVTCVVLHDTVSVDGAARRRHLRLVRPAQGRSVWYFGEDTREVRFGLVTSRAGSWEAGKDGAQPGIIMLADPQVGNRYYNEYYKGKADDQAEVMSRSEKVTVPAGTYEGVLQVKDWTDLEPGVLEHKFYARDIGIIKEEHVQGGSYRLELIKMTRGEASASRPLPVPVPGRSIPVPT
jgi:hypothetical protein